MPYANGQPTASELAAKRKAADSNSAMYGAGVSNAGNTNIGVNVPSLSMGQEYINRVPVTPSAPIQYLDNPTGGAIDTSKIGTTGQPQYSTTGSGQNVSIGNTVVPGSASSIIGSGNAFEDQYYKNLNDQYNTPIDEAAIRKQKEADYQAQLDSIKAIYADQLNQARIRGQGRQGSSSAIQARRGLIGSNVGETMTSNVENLNVQEQDLIRQEEANAIAQIQGFIRTGANEEIAAKKQAIKEGGEKLLAYYAGAGDRKAKRAQDAAKKLLAIGKDPSAVSDADLATAGIDKQDLLAEYNTLAETQKTAAAKSKLETQKTQAEIAKLQQDAATGKLDANKYYEVGNKIYEKGTNKFISDAAFNPYSQFQVTQGNQVYDPVTKTYQAPPNMGGGATGDLRGYRTQYPNEAWSGTNNPGGITVNPTFTQTLQNAGINVAGASNRPANEGGQYYVFPTIEEGMKAYNLLWQSPSYQNLTVGQALQRWGTGSIPGIDNNKKVSQLSSEEISNLQAAQIKKESPGLYTLMQKGSTQDGIAQYDPIKGPQYEQYNSKGVVPKGVDANTFKQEALEYKKESIGREATKYLDSIDKLLNTPISRKERIAINTAPSLASLKGDYADIINAFNNIISKLNIKSLTDAKAQGATFGQLSNQELKVLGDAATSLKLNSSDAEWKKQIAIIGNALLQASGQPPRYSVDNTQSNLPPPSTPSAPSEDAYALYLKSIGQ